VQYLKDQSDLSNNVLVGIVIADGSRCVRTLDDSFSLPRKPYCPTVHFGGACGFLSCIVLQSTCSRVQHNKTVIHNLIVFSGVPPPLEFLLAFEMPIFGRNLVRSNAR
jgi:hypothetical protein